MKRFILSLWFVPLFILSTLLGETLAQREIPYSAIPKEKSTLPISSEEGQGGKHKTSNLAWIRGKTSYKVSREKFGRK